MDAYEMYKFAVKQIEWYEKQTEFARGMIEWCNLQLKHSRAEDREISSYALREQPDDPVTVRIFSGKYEGTETKRLTRERAKYYREIKRNAERIAHYKREAEHWGARM